MSHTNPLQLARLFHETYERLAPQFGYETRADTRTFDPESANGRLMTAVCAEIFDLGARSTAPIDMVLHCPNCGKQHIDTPEPGHRILYADEPIREQSHGTLPGWDNPPHRTHLCHGCGHKWRPADVPTNGVAAVKTKGKADSPFASVTIASATHADAQKLRAALLEVGKWEHRGDSIAEGWDEKYGNGAWAALFEGARSTAAQPVEPTLRSAALALIAKMDALKPHMDAMCLDSHNRGRPYSGPTYGVELEALRAAASGDSTPPSEPADVPEVVRKLRDALRRLLDSDPTGSIATATDAELRSAVDDDAADPVVREQAAAVLQGRMALSTVQGDPSGAPRAEPEAVGQGRWQPIETAPKDGTEVYVWRKDCGTFIASWTSPDEMPLSQDEIDAMDEEALFQHDWFTQWPHGRRCEGSEAPTLWMHLPPEPPQAASGERGD